MKHKIDETILDEWVEIAREFKESVDKLLDEVHSAKQNIMSLRNEMLDIIDSGQYIRDEQRIIISAPEIIIGNVNKQGVLQEGGTVIIKGSDTQLHGIGEAGTIKMLAPVIEQRGIDPGIDGEEEVVYNNSRVITVARDICLDSQKPKDVEFRGAIFHETEYDRGITISSEDEVTVLAAYKNKSKKERIETRLEHIGKTIEKAEEAISFEFSKLKDINDSMKAGIRETKLLKKTNDLGRANFAAIDMLSDVFEDDMNSFSTLLGSYCKQASELAELKRQQACLEEEKKAISNEDFYKTSTTATSLTLISESIGMVSADGEGNIRTNPEAGISMIGNQISLESIDKSGALTPKEACGKISIRGRNIGITTEDQTGEQYEKGDLKSAQYPMVGNVTINSKTIDMSAVDLAMENGKFKETALTEGGSINMRAAKVKVKTIDEKGKSVGKFSVNSQKISLKSTDIKDYKAELEVDDQNNFKHPEKMSSDKVAADSQLLLLSETMNIGFKKDEMETKNLYLSSTDNVLINGNSHVQLTQGKRGSADGIIEMKGTNVDVIANGNMVVEGDSGINMYGDTTMNGAVKAGDVEVENLKASKSVTAPNITDGMNMPGSPKKNSGKSKGDEFKETGI